MAFVGPDGAGKGTLIEEVTERIPVATAVVSFARPPRQHVVGTTHQKRHGLSGVLGEAHFLLGVAATQWRRLLRTWLLAWQGYIVCCDRFPSEVVATKPKRRWLGRWIEQILLVDLVPRPDAVARLDAPEHALFARRPELRVSTLRRWRSGYARAFPSSVLIHTDGEPEQAIQRALEVVWRALATRHGWTEVQRGNMGAWTETWRTSPAATS